MIAKYTKKIMDDLRDTGMTVVFSDRIGNEVARQRIYNAASRLGYRAKTYKDGEGIIRGVLVRGRHEER